MSILARVLAVLLIAAGTVLMLPFRPAVAATVNIQVSTISGQTWFGNSGFQNGVYPTTVNVGDTVNWVFNGDGVFSQHTTTHCGADCNFPTGSPQWDSGVIQVGNFPHAFTTPGIYLYQCSIHGAEMRGQITVVAGAVGGETELANIGAGTLQKTRVAEGHFGMWLGLAAMSGGVITLTGAAWFARRRLAG
jgi:plastocyanin